VLSVYLSQKIPIQQNYHSKRATENTKAENSHNNYHLTD